MSDERDICDEWNAKKWSDEAPMLRGFGDLLAAEIRRLRGEEASVRRFLELDIHGLCPGHPMARGPAATCAVCNMSRKTLDELLAARSLAEQPGEVPDEQEGKRCTCEWKSPVTGEVDATWPAETDQRCAIHGWA